MLKLPSFFFEALFLWLAWRANRVFRALPVLGNTPLTPLPPLSIIIPARNEAANLGRLLPSLTAVQYPGRCEVIVVDDQSCDDTAAIAANFGAQVIRSCTLPPDWLGKPHACHVGATAATGEWLLFTDADTIHTATGPAQAVGTAVAAGWHGLSAILEQHTGGWWDRLALPAAYAGLFAGLPPRPNILNGQYILLRREVYEASGGFAAVRQSPLEDLALGHHLQSLGYHVPLAQGQQVAGVQMYGDAWQMWYGLTRVGGGSLRWLGRGAWVTAVFTTLAMKPILMLLWPGHFSRIRILQSWLCVAVGFLPWVRRFQTTSWLLFAPIGAVMVQLAACAGIARRLLGLGVPWKQRSVKGL